MTVRTPHHNDLAKQSNELEQIVKEGRLSEAQLSAAFAEVTRGLLPVDESPIRRVPRPRVAGRWGTPFSHSWAAGTGSAGTVNLNYTGGSPLLYDRGVRMVTPGGGASKAISDYNHPAPVDLTGLLLRVWVCVADAANLDQMTVYAGDAGQANSFAWTLGVGQAALADSQRLTPSGRYVGLTLPWSEAIVTGTPTRASIAQFRIVTRDNGASLVVDHQGIDTVAAASVFPQGVVSFTFDDFAPGQYAIGAAKLEQYGCPGTLFYGIPGQLDTGSNMTLQQAKNLDQRGHEIAAHAMTAAIHNAGGLGYPALTADQVKTDIAQNSSWLAANAFSGTDHGAWPHGARTAQNVDTARRFLKASRGTPPAASRVETLPPADPMFLRSVLIDANTPAATITALIDRAYANGEWLILAFHELKSSGASGLAYNQSAYFQIVEYARAKGIAVRSVGQVLAALS